MSEYEHVEPIRQDYLNGMTYKSIAEKYKIDQRTAKRYVERNLPLSQLEQRPYTSLLDPYESVIRSMLVSGPVFAKTIFSTLREMGYTGGYTILNRRVQQIIRDNEASGLYPPNCRRTRNIPSENKKLTQKIKEEQVYASDRI